MNYIDVIINKSMDLYCVKCKTHTSTNDFKTITTENKNKNRSALAQCGSNTFRFISANQVTNLIFFYKKNVFY